MISTADVIVVGAGFTGLSAATALGERGISTLVLEARNRVGGRVESVKNTLGERVDTGGQFLCEDMPNVMALARRRGGGLVETFMQGDFVFQPVLSKDAASRLNDASLTLRARMAAIPREEAGTLTVAQWLDTQGESAAVKSTFRSMMEGLWCQALEIVPLAYLADNDRRVTNETHELQYFPAGTMHARAEDMARGLGGSLHLAAPVEYVSRHDNGVAVTAAGGGRFEARQALIAVPPVAASRIRFEPALPATLAAALSVWRSGMAMKILLRYPTPFWRAKGLSGMVMWRKAHGLFACDASRDADHAALVVFIGGPLALEWREKPEGRLREDLLAHLKTALGPEAAAPIAFTSRDWCGDRWSGGAYSDIVVDPRVHAEAALLDGWPPLHFASSELSPSFPGYIEGALVAGNIAAERIAEDLQR